VVYNDEPFNLNTYLDVYVGQLINAGVDGRQSYDLILPDDFVIDVRSGGEVSLFLTALSDSVGFTFNAYNASDEDAPQLLITADIPPIAVAAVERQVEPDIWAESSWGYESRGTAMYVMRLDGTQSIGATTYAWEQLAGEPVTMRDTSSVTAQFDAPQWDGSTELTPTQARLQFRLTVDEGVSTDDCEVYIRIPGDANGDDQVNAFDVALLRLFDPDADFNADGIVNAFDLAILRQNSGRKRTAQ